MGVCTGCIRQNCIKTEYKNWTPDCRGNYWTMKERDYFKEKWTAVRKLVHMEGSISAKRANP